MVNRLQHLTGATPGATSYTDHYVVRGFGVSYIVPLSTALALERQLDQAGERAWIEFQDVFGARHRMTAGCIYRISESTRETRAAVRAFDRAMEKEEKEDGDPLADLV
jgi:hypothetical protein